MADLLIAALIAGMAWLLVRAVRYWTQRRGILDVPNRRSSHSCPTPRGGGLAIVLICLVGFAVYCAFRRTYPGPTALGYCLGAALVAAVSWSDDLRDLSSLARFAAHTSAAILLVLLCCGAASVVELPLVGKMPLGWLGPPIALLWVVGLTNAYNFMDGIDGIAGAQGVVAGVGWLVLGRLADQPAIAALGLLAGASSLGFLPHNRPPARIFMGDVGSAFLGFTFAFLTLAGLQANPRLGTGGILLVWPFVFDAAVTFLRRLRRGENVFSAHRSHLYQRLVICGWTHGAVTMLYTALALLGLVLAVVFLVQPRLGAWLVAILLPLAALSLWILVGHQESKHPAEVASIQTGKEAE